MGKSVIILSNFWDANSVIDQSYIIHPVKDKIYKINLYSNKDDSNYSVYSIALSHPELKKLTNLTQMTRLDVFCPTYDMLKRYKEDDNWEKYTEDYMNLLKARKKRMGNWLDSLVEDRVYFLCCWENTSGKAHCHREILYKVMSESKKINEKAIVIYRKGDEIKKRKEGTRREEDGDLEFVDVDAPVPSHMITTSFRDNIPAVASIYSPLYVSNALNSQSPRRDSNSRRNPRPVPDDLPF